METRPVRDLQLKKKEKEKNNNKNAHLIGCLLQDWGPGDPVGVVGEENEQLLSVPYLHPAPHPYLVSGTVQVSLLTVATHYTGGATAGIRLAI